ncbi:hypothetical protein JCM10207_001820 [Rhodosporidiobolus poonsookiae]
MLTSLAPVLAAAASSPAPPLLRRCYSDPFKDNFVLKWDGYLEYQRFNDEFEQDMIDVQSCLDDAVAKGRSAIFTGGEWCVMSNGIDETKLGHPFDDALCLVPCADDDLGSPLNHQYLRRLFQHFFNL